MLKRLIRIALTTLLIVWLISRVDMAQVGAIIAGANGLWLAAGAAISVLPVIFAAWRWQVLLAGLQIEQRFGQIVRIVLVGSFFSMFLPSSVGGDVMKMLLIAPNLSQREVAVSSVLMDRVVGMAVTIGMGLLAVLMLPSVWGDARVLIALGGVAAAFCVGVVALFSRTLIELAGKLIPAFLWRRVGGPALRVHHSLVSVRRRPDILIGAALISLLRQIAICLSVFCAGQAFGIAAPLVAYFAMVPLSMAITVLPIAINGLGLQDNALIFLMATVGVTAAQALSLSLFLHVVRYGTGLVGGMVFALQRRSTPAQPAPSSFERPGNEGDRLQPVRR